MKKTNGRKEPYGEVQRAEYRERHNQGQSRAVKSSSQQVKYYQVSKAYTYL